MATPVAVVDQFAGKLREIVAAKVERDQLPLPSMPKVAARAIEMMRDHGVNLAHISTLIETDPVDRKSVV